MARKLAALGGAVTVFLLWVMTAHFGQSSERNRLGLSQTAQYGLGWKDPIAGVSGGSPSGAFVLWSATGNLSTIHTEGQREYRLPSEIFTIGAYLHPDGSVELLDENLGRWLLARDGELQRLDPRSIIEPDARAIRAVYGQHRWWAIAVVSAGAEAILYSHSDKEWVSTPTTLAPAAAGLSVCDERTYLFERHSPFRMWKVSRGLIAEHFTLPNLDYNQQERVVAVLCLGDRLAQVIATGQHDTATIVFYESNGRLERRSRTPAPVLLTATSGGTLLGVRRALENEVVVWVALGGQLS